MTRLWFQSCLLPGGWAERVRINILQGRIHSVEVGISPEPDDERHAIGVPGLPNVHSHAFQRGMAGRAEIPGPAGDDFWSWRDTMYRFVDAIDPDDLAAIAAFAYMEMLEAGFTRVGEFHYLHHDRGGRPFADPAEMAHSIVAAAQTAGIGLTLLPAFYAHSGFGGAAPEPRQARFITSIDAYAKLLDRSRQAVSGLDDALVGVAPHSLRACTPDELSAVIGLNQNGPVHIHLAEQAKEVTDCVSWCGRRPATWLLDEFAIDEKWCLVHATHIDDRELERIARSGAVVGLCPLTEANLGDGIFPAANFAARSGLYGIGSDSNVLIDPRKSCASSNTANAWRLCPQRHGHRRGPLDRASALSSRHSREDLVHWALRLWACALVRPLISWPLTRITTTWRAGSTTRSSTAGSSPPGVRRSTASGGTAEKSSPAAVTSSATRSHRDFEPRSRRSCRANSPEKAL